MPTLTAIPPTIVAGDSYSIALSLADYPASAGWSLLLAIAGPSSEDWTSVADGDRHLLTLSSASTTPLEAGGHRYAVKAINGSTVTTVERGILTVEADVAAMPPGTGTLWAEKALAVVEAALSNTLDGEMRMFMIDGRQVQTFSLAELTTLRSRLRQEVAAARRGSAFGRVAVGFVR